MKYSTALLVALIPQLLGISAAQQITSSPSSFARSTATRRQSPQPPDQYFVDFVSTAATGYAMNDSGDVVGTSYVDVGCGSFCLPPQETVAWRAGERIVLPGLPGLTESTATDINDAGWIVGYAGSYSFPRAVVWRPVGDTYQAIDLGFLPGTNKSKAVGIDDQNRVVGWSTDGNAISPVAAPFFWSVSTGMVDLSLLGYPDEEPLAMSPGGTVASAGHWYRLGDPGSVHAMAPGPPGFAVGSYATAINDAGDQARFLVRVSGQNLVYLYRYRHEGTWQQLSPVGTGNLTTYGIGSINDQLDVTGTIQSTGVVAFGPDGTAQSLTSLLTSAYPGSTVTRGGPLNANGRILAQVMIGNSPRLVRLTPAQVCGQSCMRVADLNVEAWFVPDPSDPSQDHCAPELNAHNVATVTIQVTDVAGFAIAGAVVSGRFLDDYWTDDPVLQATNAAGTVSFQATGHCGVGAIAFLVDDVTHQSFVLDERSGVLAGKDIPQMP